MKVNIGKSNHKKSYFPISFDSSTSLNFGEVIPFFSHELVPDSHINIDFGQAVRFSPLSFPTFGKADLKSFVCSYKMCDLYPPFNDMLAQTPFTSYNGTTYVPSSVPSLPLFYLWLTVFSQADFCLYTGYGTQFADGSSEGFWLPQSSPLSFSSFNLVGRDITDLSSGSDLGSSSSIHLEDISSSLVLWLVNHILNNPLQSSHPELASFDGDFAQYLYDYLTAPGTHDQLVSDVGGGIFSSRFVDAFDPNSADLIVPIPYSSVTSDSQQDYAQLPGYIVGQGGNLSFHEHCFGLKGQWVNNTREKIFVGVRLNNSGKFLRKLFLGLGYQLSPLDTPVSILPLYAYFRSYFDLFAPKRFVKFEQSYFARKINEVVNKGVSLEISITTLGTPFGWSNIIDDLLSCYYTKNTDYYSAQILGLINKYGADLSQNYLSEAVNGQISVKNVSSFVGKNNVPKLNFGSDLTHTQSQQNILSRLTQFVNRRSLLGGKVAELLSSVFGISKSSIDEYNGYIGSHVLDVEIGDVFSTAETSEGSLGEYAGKALAFGRSDNFSFDTDIHSIVIGMQTLVPRTQYVNGLNPLLTHVNHDDFYNPMFDGLTLLPSRSSSFYCPNSFYNFNDKSFGNIPLYTEYKTKSQGILSGDLSLPSTRASFDSFTMDEVIDGYSVYEPNSNLVGDDVAGNLQRIEAFFPRLVAGTMWRYLGRWIWLGRFDRIFVNNRFNYTDFLKSSFDSANLGSFSSIRDMSRSDDNIIVHNIIDFKINAPMLPLADSFMTQDINELRDSGITSQSE